MSTTVKTHKGKQVWVSASRPATNDAAGFEALSDWTRLTGYVGGLALGMEGSSVEAEDIALGLTLTGRGLDAGKESEISYRRVDSDAGQALIDTIVATCEGFGSVKVIAAACNAAAVAGDPVAYAQGYFMGGGDNEITGGDPDQGIVTFKQELPTVKDDEPA